MKVEQILDVMSWVTGWKRSRNTPYIGKCCQNHLELWELNLQDIMQKNFEKVGHDGNIVGPRPL